MATLKEALGRKIPGVRDEIKKLVKEHGTTKIGEVTVEQAYGGMRGIKGLVCDTSEVDNNRGVIIGGIHVSELTGKSPEEILWLLLMGELPDAQSLETLKAEIKKRSAVPEYVWDVLKAMPKDSHPMTMFSTAVLVMDKESLFKKRYDQGMRKEEYWEPMLEDALDLIARAPAIAAGIYRLRYNKGPIIASNPELDLSANFANMLGIKDADGRFADLMRLYLVLHSDHESGNVSAFATHTVASALSNLYYAVSAGLDGLAGPLHGLANQECLKWILMVKDTFKGAPTEEQLHKFAWDTLESGKVVPGYGHAVLRQTDPRFTAFVDYGKRYCANDEVFQIVEKVFTVVPPILVKQGKAKDPWPNVDAASGALLWHFGMTEFDYYTVLFGVSRIIGISAQAIMARATGSPLVRPKSVTTRWMKETVAKAAVTA